MRLRLKESISPSVFIRWDRLRTLWWLNWRSPCSSQRSMSYSRFANTWWRCLWSSLFGWSFSLFLPSCLSSVLWCARSIYLHFLSAFWRCCNSHSWNLFINSHKRGCWWRNWCLRALWCISCMTLTILFIKSFKDGLALIIFKLLCLEIY